MVNKTWELGDPVCQRMILLWCWEASWFKEKPYSVSNHACLLVCKHISWICFNIFCLISLIDYFHYFSLSITWNTRFLAHLSLAHLSRRLLGELIGRHPSSARSPSTFSNVISSEAMKPILRPGEQNSVFFFFFFFFFFLFQSDKNSCCYGNYWLIMGKEETGIFAISLQIFRFFFYRNVSWVVLYDSYEFCSNRWIWLVAMAT